MPPLLGTIFRACYVYNSNSVYIFIYLYIFIYAHVCVCEMLILAKNHSRGMNLISHSNWIDLIRYILLTHSRSVRYLTWNRYYLFLRLDFFIVRTHHLLIEIACNIINYLYERKKNILAFYSYARKRYFFRQSLLHVLLLPRFSSTVLTSFFVCFFFLLTLVFRARFGEVWRKTEPFYCF